MTIIICGMQSTICRSSSSSWRSLTCARFRSSISVFVPYHLTIFPTWSRNGAVRNKNQRYSPSRSEEHTSELQSPDHLVCRLLLEKKNLQRIFFCPVPPQDEIRFRVISSLSGTVAVVVHQSPDVYQIAS